MALLNDGRTSLRLHFVAFLVLFVGVISRAAGEKCLCETAKYRYKHYYTSDDVCEGLARNVNCCVFGVLGFNDPNATVQWTFNGKPLEASGARKELICQNQTLFNKGTEMSDKGNYTCIVTSSNGTVGSLTTYLKVHGSNGFQEGPKDVKAPSEVCSWKGGSVKLTCEGMVGKPGGFCDSGGYIEWFMYVDGERDFPPKSSVTPPVIASDGTIRSSIVFESVESHNFGMYECNVKNMYQINVRNISFIEGDPQYCGTVNASKMSVLVLAPIAFIILAIPYLWWRFRTTVKLMYNERRHKKYARDGFLRDVFIVHGNKASSWVFGELVHTLEEKYGYSCYVPVRDMLGGDQYAEAISKEMRKCRRVLVVMTPCLLQSQWASWSATHGIGTCFKSSSILRLVLQDFGNDAISSETAVFLKTLKPIGMLKVPKACRQQEEVVTALYEDEEPRKSLGNGFLGDRLGENASVPMTESSLSPSPKHQRLSNMITGSNNTSRETLNEGYDCRKEEQKKVVVPPAIYLEDIDCAKEPGSPCSVTPFILPTCKNRVQDTPPCFPFLNCMRAVFIGDPETVFWQKVRLFLDPPTVRRKITLESTA